jgi:5-methyltetrahydrofolate--homocysteine methyltransferase
VGAGIQLEHTAVIGTIKADLHDIGKNLVAMMWKGATIGVIDLGTDVSPARFLTATQEHHADIVGISALLTTTMVVVKDVVAVLRAAAPYGIKVVIGGAQVTREFADQIGADACALDAGGAVEAARRALVT